MGNWPSESFALDVCVWGGEEVGRLRVWDEPADNVTMIDSVRPIVCGLWMILPVDCAMCGRVVECRICSREVAGSNLGRGYFTPRSTQPSTPPGSVNEYQL